MQGNAYESKSIIKINRIFSITAIVLGIIVIFNAMSMFNSSSLSSIRSLVIFDGALLVFLGIWINLRLKNFRRYLDIIVNQNTNSIDQIAKEVNKTPKRVKRELKNMIRYRYFADAYINEYDRIILKGLNNNTSSGQTYSSKDIEIVICKSCGAKNTVPTGTVGNCEYCGSPLSK